jgi:hypothetical protein
MNRPLFIVSLLLLLSLFAQSQDGYLFVKKGIKKKKTYNEGSRIFLQTKGDTLIGGIITMLRNDTIWINGLPVPAKKVKAVFPSQKQRKKFHVSTGEFLLITGGVALATAGLTLSKQEQFKDALIAGSVIGYGNLGIQYLMSKLSFKRKKYRIGRKFQLQVLDFHIPRRRGF